MIDYLFVMSCIINLSDQIGLSSGNVSCNT